MTVTHLPLVAGKNDSDNYEKLIGAFKGVFEQRLAEERRSGGLNDAARRRYSNPGSPYQQRRERRPYGEDPQSPQRLVRSTACSAYDEADEPNARAQLRQRSIPPLRRDKSVSRLQERLASNKCRRYEP